jgi:uroporphyrin-III C-methyltransferase
MKKPMMVTLVGAGPGDPELLTLKAIRAIRQATVLLVDELVSDAVLRYAKRSARIIFVGKRGGCKSTPQAFIEKLMLQEAQSGERVVRLKGGDPFIFGRGGEEAQHLREHGVEVHIVNGITAGLAAATSLNVPLTHRDHAHGVIFITGHAKENTHSAQDKGACVHWPTLGAACAQGLTLVIYMGVAQASKIQNGLLETLAPNTPLAVVQHASLPQQRHATGTLGELTHLIAQEQLGSPAIIIVGDVLRGAAAAGVSSDIHVAA